MLSPRLSVCLWAGAMALLARSVVAQPATGRTWDEKRIALPKVGSGMAYVPHTPTNHVVLFISGDGGWNAGVVEMARRIAGQEAVVIGVSYPVLRRTAAREGGC